MKTTVIQTALANDLSSRISPVVSEQLADFDSPRYVVFPGFCDVHVHFREPGFSYKETVYTGSLSAARGGYTAVCTMPNLNPVPDSVENLNLQRSIIKRMPASTSPPTVPSPWVKRARNWLTSKVWPPWCAASLTTAGVSSGMR